MFSALARVVVNDAALVFSAFALDEVLFDRDVSSSSSSEDDNADPAVRRRPIAVRPQCRGGGGGLLVRSLSPLQQPFVTPRMIVLDLDGTILAVALADISVAHLSVAQRRECFVDPDFFARFAAAAHRRGHALRVASFTDAVGGGGGGGVTAADEIIALFDAVLPLARSYLCRSATDIVCGSVPSPCRGGPQQQPPPSPAPPVRHRASNSGLAQGGRGSMSNMSVFAASLVEYPPPSQHARPPRFLARHAVSAGELADLLRGSAVTSRDGSALGVACGGGGSDELQHDDTSDMFIPRVVGGGGGGAERRQRGKTGHIERLLQLAAAADDLPFDASHVVLVDDSRDNCRSAALATAFCCEGAGLGAAWYAAQPELQRLLGVGPVELAAIDVEHALL